jgi:sialate O-acetylesterase
MVKLADVFGDGMVLQRERPIPVWGSAVPGSEVRVTLGDQSEVTTSDPDGVWSVIFEPRAAARGLELVTTADHDSVTVTDVAVGEVWIAGGQSNMEFQLEFDADRDEVLSGPMSADIRFFDVPKISYEGQDREHDYGLFGFWRRCTADDLRYFSAVGYYFARDLEGALDVPVGIIGCNWGGTPACTWADPEILNGTPARVWIEDYESGLRAFNVDDEAAAFRSHAMSNRTDPFGDPVLYRLLRDGSTEYEERELLVGFAANFLPTIGLLHPNRPGGLFETMVRTIAPYAARGVIWYQGESDAVHAEIYSSALGAVIESWRHVWDEPELAFLITQLAPFDGTVFGTGDLFPLIREQQETVAKTVPGVWMASTSDVGSVRDIHPKIKRPIGNRLALLARGHVYGEDLLCDAPALDRAERSDREVTLHFRHAGPLTWDGSLLPLQLTPPHGEELVINGIRVDGSALSITGHIPLGTRVDFAGSGYYTVGLRNSAGIPALPFQTTLH